MAFDRFYRPKCLVCHGIIVYIDLYVQSVAAGGQLCIRLFVVRSPCLQEWLVWFIVCFFVCTMIQAASWITCKSRVDVYSSYELFVVCLLQFVSAVPTFRLFGFPCLWEGLFGLSYIFVCKMDRAASMITVRPCI